MRTPSASDETKGQISNHEAGVWHEAIVKAQELWREWEATLKKKVHLLSITRSQIMEGCCAKHRLSRAAHVSAGILFVTWNDSVKRRIRPLPRKEGNVAMVEPIDTSEGHLCRLSERCLKSQRNDSEGTSLLR